jgi:hypothetical protein
MALAEALSGSAQMTDLMVVIPFCNMDGMMFLKNLQCGLN